MITIPQKKRLANFLYGGDRSEIEILSPENFYIGLSTQSIGEEGKVVGEPEFGDTTGYTRVKLINNSSSFNQDAEGIVSNKEAIKWPNSKSSWGRILSVFISPYEAPQENEEALYVAATDITVNAGVNLYYEKGALKLNIDSGEDTDEALL